MSVLVILEKTLVCLWYVLTWLCGVRRRQGCVEEAHESMGVGVVEREQPPILVEQNLSQPRRRNVVMTDGIGHSDSSSVNFISFSSQCILSSVTQGQEVQQTCSNHTQGVQTGRPKVPVVEGVENGLSKVRYTPTLYTSGFMYTGLVMKHSFALCSWATRVWNSDRMGHRISLLKLLAKYFIHFPQAVHEKSQTLYGKRSNMRNLMAVQNGVNILSILKQWHSRTHGH